MLKVDVEELRDKIKNDGKLILRPSMLQQFLGCPFQWYQAALRENFQRPAAAAVAGTSLHKGAELGYKDKIATGNLPPLSFLTDVVAEKWKELNEKQDLEYSKGEDYYTYENDLIKGMKDYYEDLMPLTDPIAVEKRYTIKIDHPVFKAISGTLDIILDRGVVDLKHTKRKTTADRYVLQQSTYTLLRKQNGEVSNYNEIHNVIRGKGVERLALKAKEEYARSVINTILDVTEKFWETGDPLLFRGTNKYAYYLCSKDWCGYYKQCPYQKGF